MEISVDKTSPLLSLPRPLWTEEILKHFTLKTDLLTLRTINKWFRVIVAESNKLIRIFPLLFCDESLLTFQVWTESFPYLQPRVLFADIISFGNISGSGIRRLSNDVISVHTYAPHYEVLIIGGRRTYEIEYNSLSNLNSLLSNSMSILELDHLFSLSLRKIIICTRYTEDLPPLNHTDLNRNFYMTRLINELFMNFKRVFPGIELFVAESKEFNMLKAKETWIEKAIRFVHRFFYLKHLWD